MSNEIEEFKNYLDEILAHTDLEKDDKIELEEELNQHLYDSYHNHIQHGATHHEAIYSVMAQFGNAEFIREEIKNSYPSAKKQHAYKEIIVWGVCMIASIIGPGLLIGAHFQFYFISSPIFYLGLSYLFYHHILKKLKSSLLTSIGFIVAYCSIAYLFYSMIAKPFQLKLYAQYMYSFKLDELTGINGLVEFPTMHMMWYVLILWTLYKWNKYQPFWKVVFSVSFRFWALLFISIIIAKGTSSAEQGVIAMNIMLLYGFLQEMIQPISLTKLKLSPTNLIQKVFKI